MCTPKELCLLKRSTMVTMSASALCSESYGGKMGAAFAKALARDQREGRLDINFQCAPALLGCCMLCLNCPDASASLSNSWSKCRWLHYGINASGD